MDSESDQPAPAGSQASGASPGLSSLERTSSIESTTTVRPPSLAPPPYASTTSLALPSYAAASASTSEQAPTGTGVTPRPTEAGSLRRQSQPHPRPSVTQQRTRSTSASSGPKKEGVLDRLARMREENEARRKKGFEHVSPKEAERITNNGPNVNHENQASGKWSEILTWSALI